MLILLFSVLAIIAISSFILPIERMGSEWNVFFILSAFVLFLTVFWNITYTNDRYNYEVLIANLDDYDTDFIFKSIVLFGNNYNWQLEEIYHFHILIMAILCILFIANFTNRILYIVLFICIFRFVDYANQIRFYFGFFIALNSLYLWHVKQSKLFSLFLAILAILSHSSLIIVYLIIPIYKFLSNVPVKKMMIYLLVSSLMLQVIVGTAISFFPQFAKYFIKADGKSSLLGGVFDALPLFYIFALIITNHKLLIKSGSYLIGDKKYIFLYALSIFSFLLIPYGIFYRIVMDRFIFSFCIVWLCLLVYSLRSYPRGDVGTQKFKIVIFSISSIIWFYYASYFFLNKGFYLKEALMMLELK